VRFNDEGNGEELLAKLQQVRYTMKLKVNMSRFVREVEPQPSVVALNPGRGNPSGVAGGEFGLNVEDGVSYAAVVSAEQGVTIGAVRSKPISEVLEVACEIPAGRVKELSDCVIGLLVPKLDVHRVREQLIIAGMANIKMVALGGNQVLVSSPIKGFLKESLLDRRDWWMSWFLGFTKWTLDVPQPGRCVWLRVLGAPVPLWCAKVFESVGAVFGEVLEVDINDSCYEFSRVMVLLPGILLVVALVNMVADTRTFPVYVSEELPSVSYSCRDLPATGASATAGGVVVGEEGVSDEEGWGEDIGMSYFTSAGSERWEGEKVSNVRGGLGEGTKIPFWRLHPLPGIIVSTIPCPLHLLW